MASRSSKVLNNYKETQIKSKSILQELDDLRLLRTKLLPGRKFKVPTMFDRDISTNFTCPFSPIKHVEKS